MKTRYGSIFARVSVCALAMAVTVSAGAQTAAPQPRVSAFSSSCIGYCGPSILVGALLVAGVGTGVAIGITYAVRHGHSVSGCTVASPGGLQLQTPGEGQIYDLAGETASLKAGERIRVSGRKKKKDAGGTKVFLVQKLSKDYGLCTVQPVTR
jgi:hypothetical protein